MSIYVCTCCKNPKVYLLPQSFSIEVPDDTPTLFWPLIVPGIQHVILVERVRYCDMLRVRGDCSWDEGVECWMIGGEFPSGVHFFEAVRSEDTR